MCGRCVCTCTEKPHSFKPSASRVVPQLAKVCAVLYHAVLCCALLQLREASETDGKAARALVKLRLFRQFYVIVIVFIYFTRIVVYLLRSTLPYQHQWLADFISCLAYLALYVWVGYNFRPNAENPYTKVSQQEEIEMGL